MKKFYFVLSAIFITLFAQGQSYMFEGFGSGYWPPEGWTPLPIGPQWSLSQTNYAGGVLPEARLQGFEYTGTVRLLSPLIDLSDADTVLLSFRYFTEINDSAAPALGVSTRVGGGAWVVAWETTLKNSHESREFEVLLTGDQLGHSDFQFSFFIEGDMTKLFNFYLDNIKLYYPTTGDGKLDEILTPAHVEGPVPVEGRVLNLGNTIIHEVRVSWLTNMGIKHDSLFTGLNLGLFDSFTFQFDRWWVSPFGDYNLKMWISSVNGAADPYHANDTLNKLINYSLPPRPMRPPCLETFTASWCGPCKIWADVYDPWCVDHPDAVIIKYQLDDYETPEGHSRLVYYELDMIPFTFCNGKLVANVDTNDLDTAYYQAKKLHSDFLINSSFTVENKVITIHNNILPYATAYGTRVQTAVLEKTTYGNVGSNGQTEFHNVEMKMFPASGQGESVNFYTNMPYTNTIVYNLDTTNIEEFDDLRVAVFIQQDSSKEILQSAYALENVDFSAEDRLAMITLDGIPLEGFDPDNYYYEVELPQTTVESPVVCGVPMDEGAMVLVQQAFELPNPAVIDVYPESRGTLKRYVVNLSISTGVPTPDLSEAVIFPNPTDGKVFISGINIISVNLYTLDGRLVLNKEGSIENMIDLSGIKSGVYILGLMNNQGLLLRKKILIM